MNKTILVTGGAGFVGSHTAYLLASRGYRVIIVDHFAYQQPFRHSWATVIHADIRDKERMTKVFAEYHIDAVMHFAASIDVARSMTHPQEFYDNNVGGTLLLLDVMRQAGVGHFIFSSSCAIYGNPVTVPIDEHHPYNPLNPYGQTKLVIERALEDGDRHYVSLRYFNAAGALPEESLGEYHVPETHIIPLMLRAAKQQTPFTIYGTDYPTADGTAIRDYVHVTDIAHAHLLAFEHLERAGASDCFNIGTGSGYSVREMIRMAEKITASTIVVEEQGRRPGDAAVLVADARKAQRVLQWQPNSAKLEFIIKSAARWEELMQNQNRR